MKLYITLFALIISQLLNGQTEGTPDIIRGNESFTLMVKVEDADTNMPIDGTEVYLYQTQYDQLIGSESSLNGYVSFAIDPFTEYEIRTCNTEYFKNGLSIYECNEGNEILCTFGASNYSFVAGGGKDKPNAILKATLKLSPMKIGSVYELSNVYYDLDKSNLRQESKAGIDCSESLHQKNRRTEIEILEYEPLACQPSLDIDFKVKDLKGDYDDMPTEE